jgi:hypothetical protein
MVEKHYSNDEIGRNNKDGFQLSNWIAIIIFFIQMLLGVAFYYGVFKTQLEAKPNESRVREIIKEELVNKFSITDGEVLKAQFKNIEEKINETNTLIKQHMLKDTK